MYVIKRGVHAIVLRYNIVRSGYKHAPTPPMKPQPGLVQWKQRFRTPCPDQNSYTSRMRASRSSSSSSTAADAALQAHHPFFDSKDPFALQRPPKGPCRHAKGVVGSPPKVPLIPFDARTIQVQCQSSIPCLCDYKLIQAFRWI